MPTYVTLWNWTAEGVQNAKESPARLDEAKQPFESLGGELKDMYLTFGQYDLVLVAEFPDDKTAAQANLSIAQGGTASSETLKAFTEDEFREVVSGLPG